MFIKAGKKILKNSFPRLHQQWKDYQENPNKDQITQILNQKDHVFCGEEIFHKLQNAYPIVPKYGYSNYQIWSRGVERSSFLMKDFDLLQSSPQKILEVGCGDGMTGKLLSEFGHQVTLLDMDDWRDSRAKSLEFIQCSLTERMPIADETYDFIFSYNTFEHVLNPQKALNELLRICKNGGSIYLNFGPLYFSAWGLHAFEALNMPYPQFLFPEKLYLKKIKELGNFDLGRNLEALQPLNKWRVHQYDQLFENANAKLISYLKSKHFSYLKVIKQFPKSFGGLNLTYEDVAVHALRVTLRKIV